MSAARIDERERAIQMLQPLLKGDPERFVAILGKFQSKGSLG
jgi:hypothetical protein